MSKLNLQRMQSEISECGLACIAVCLQIHGVDTDLSTLRQRFSSSSRGLTFKEIAEIAAMLDLATRAVKCEVSDLSKLATPAILHWNFNHFIVYRRRSLRGKYQLFDPLAGEMEVDETLMSNSFTGIALEVFTSPGFQKRKERSPLSLWSLLRFRGGVGASLAQALLVSLVLQAYVLASPFFLQLAVDEAVLKGDTELLFTLALGFGLFSLFNAGAEVLRGFALQRVSSLLSWDMTSRLFHHMLRLPLSWFQRRRLADALTRFDSLEPIKALISNGFIAGVFDGVLSVALLIAMLIYAPYLALVAILITTLITATRLISIPTALGLGVKALQSSIAEKGKRIETLRAMQTIKLMSGESDRERDWANRFGDSVVASQANANFQVGIRSVQTLLEGTGSVILVYLASKSVLAGSMSVGMLYAFLGYRQQFGARVTNLIDQIVAWRMLDLHSDRLADIAMQQREDGIDQPVLSESSINGQIELTNVSYRYSSFEPFVLRNISILIEEGELIAIIGPSGIGKSTLLKVLLGLYPVTSGEVRYDGLPITAVGLNTVRKSLGVVMQDDELLSGSILENVCFFNSQPDHDLVWKSLSLAAIDDEVRKMPMQIHTLIGDMGSNLSGGQRQRLLLARALYRQPRILILDEATSNLDVMRERRIHQSLNELAITRIIVTHRPETMRLADRVLKFEQGRLVLTDAKSGLKKEPVTVI